MKSKTKTILLTVFVLILLGIIAFLCYMLLQKGNNEVQQQTNSNSNLVIDTTAESYTSEAVKELEGMNTNFYGIPDGSVSKSSSILLRNPEENGEIYMEYTIVNEANNEEVLKTDLIESGKAVEWCPGEKLETGTYTFSFIEQPYYKLKSSDDWIKLARSKFHVTIEILE